MLLSGYAPKLLGHFTLFIVVSFFSACSNERSGDESAKEHDSNSYRYDFMLFNDNYLSSLGNYNPSNVPYGRPLSLFQRLQIRDVRRQKIYQGIWNSNNLAEIERYVLYDILSRKEINYIFFSPRSLFPVQSLVSRYPKQKFILTSYGLKFSHYKIPSNLKIAQLQLEQGAFIAGVIAGKMTRKNRVGMLTDMSRQAAQISRYAFVQGVRKVNPNSKISVAHADPNPDVVENETTLMASKERVDVIFAMSTNHNDIIIRTASHFGREILFINSWLLNAYADAQWPKLVVTSLTISLERILMDFIQRNNQSFTDFLSFPSVTSYDLSDRHIMSFSWDNEKHTIFEALQPQYRKLSKEARKEALRWIELIIKGSFTVFNALNHPPPPPLEDFYFRQDARQAP